MELKAFESLVIRAGYRMAKTYDASDGSERRIYTRAKGGPLINVRVEDDDVDDLYALVIEAMLDEEGYFEED